MTDRSEYEMNKLKDDVLKVGRDRARECGLCITNPADWFPQANLNIAVYRAEDIHELLGAGVEMEGRKTNASNGLEYTQFLDIPKDRMHWKPTLKSLVIGIKPLHVETRGEKLEKFLEELLRANAPYFTHNHQPSINSVWLNRARALLEGRDT